MTIEVKTMEHNMFNSARLPNEPFEEYKFRRKRENIAVANRIVQVIAIKDVPVGQNKKYSLSRTDFRIMKRTATEEYNNAKELGISDTQILDALYSGTKEQEVYAKFLENEIVGK